MRFWTELKWTRGDSADRVPRLDVGRNMAFRLWSLPVLVLLLGVACSSGGSDEVPLPDLTPFPADLQGRMHEIRDATADLRGLPINEEVEEGKLSRDALRSYWDEVGRSVSDEDIRKIEELTNIFRLLHMIDDERNYLELFLSFQSEAVIGFYLPDEGTLVLVEPGEQFGLRDELTLSHEYVHTLQDAWWNDPALEELQEQDETEYGTTISCVFEGDASLTSILYMSKVHGATWLEEMRAEAEPEEKSEEEIPPAFQRYFGFDYNECVLFVLAVFVDRGWAGIDALYEKLPSTTEQILHPEKYFALRPQPICRPRTWLGGWVRGGRGLNSAGLASSMFSITCSQSAARRSLPKRRPRAGAPAGLASTTVAAATPLFKCSIFPWSGTG